MRHPPNEAAVTITASYMRNCVRREIILLNIELCTYSYHFHGAERSFWGTGSRSARQGILRLFWNPEIHNWARKTPPLDPILSQMNPVHILNTHISLKLCFNVVLSSTFTYRKCLFPSGFPTKILCAILISPCVTYAAHLIFVNLMTLVIFSEGYKLWNSSVCNFLH
jgi:hypothetical protein